MSIFQFIAVFFALFMMYVARIKSQKHRLPQFEMWLWILLWAGFAFLAIFPEVLLGVVHTLNFARVFDLLIVIAFAVLTTLVFFLYFAVKELQQKLEKTIRNEAINSRQSRQ